MPCSSPAQICSTAAGIAAKECCSGNHAWPADLLHKCSIMASGHSGWLLGKLSAHPALRLQECHLVPFSPTAKLYGRLQAQIRCKPGPDAASMEASNLQTRPARDFAGTCTHCLQTASFHMCQQGGQTTATNIRHRDILASHDGYVLGAAMRCEVHNAPASATGHSPVQPPFPPCLFY